jgi:hypothetical protein
MRSGTISVIDFSYSQPIYITPSFYLLKVWQRPYAHIPQPVPPAQSGGSHIPPTNNSCHESTQSTSYPPDPHNPHNPHEPPPPGHPENGGSGDPHYNEQYEELSCPACILQVTNGQSAP